MPSVASGDVSVYDFREACLVNLRNKPKETPGGNRHKGLGVGRLTEGAFHLHTTRKPKRIPGTLLGGRSWGGWWVIFTLCPQLTTYLAPSSSNCNLCWEIGQTERATASISTTCSAGPRTAMSLSPGSLLETQKLRHCPRPSQSN